MRKIIISIFTIIIFLFVFIISNYENVTKTVFKPNPVVEAKAGLLDENLIGVVKGGTTDGN